MQSRRQFLGLGAAAVTSLLHGRRARAAALRAEGQARHLSVPVRRTFADRSVRSQAGACETASDRIAGVASAWASG